MCEENPTQTFAASYFFAGDGVKYSSDGNCAAITLSCLKGEYIHLFLAKRAIIIAERLL